MSADFVLITDSSCDLPADYYKQHEIPVLSIGYSLAGRDYKDDAGISISYSEFYSRLRGGEMPVTAMINMQSYVDEFEKHLRQGKDILYFGFSSALSGSYGGSVMAAQELRAKYPERKIYTVDGLCASMGQGLLLYYLVRLRDEGKSIEQVRDFAEEKKLDVVHLFTVDNLMHLHRGGRVSKASAVAGTIIGIKPMLDVNHEGRLIAREKVRSRKSAILRLATWMEERSLSRQHETVMISHGDCREDVGILEGLLKERFQIGRIIVNHIGPVIGAHAGPGTIALFFFGKKREA